MTRVTAREELIARYQARLDPSREQEREKMGHIAQLVRILVSRGHTIKTAAPIAKRAYRMGIRIY